METLQENAQIQVRFITQQRKYAVTDSVIFVPSSLRRYGLSEIINHLLNFGWFDFIMQFTIIL